MSEDLEEPTFWIKPDRRQKADRRSSGIGGRRTTDTARRPTDQILSRITDLVLERTSSPAVDITR
ncbi:MAG: hypothetical protein C5B57_13190 [Blastocatellia bacterium]|nr:MAG: hypothetical protein C5B57_13190 [Blastocatellia bacterium]